ncbi:MAG: hypothetical protein KTR32_34805 [Granulosicoccus sp.]|nr:hypothetical protein [Granulosicoccus sp.]
MSSQPTLTPQTDIPAEVRDLCTRVNQVAEGLPVLLFLPNQDYSRLYPLVVIRDDASEYAGLVDAYLEGERMDPPTKAMKRQQELPLEAIHAAADYLPAIVFLPAGKKLHPINLVPESVPAQLQPCYLALQHAQKNTIGKQPIDVMAICDA